MKITSTSDVSNHHIFSLIVGASGVGKTSLAKTLPQNETLILSAESGLLSIKDSNIDVITISTFQDMIDTYTFLRTDAEEGTMRYKYIFLDSLTEIGEILFHELKPTFTKQQSFGLYEMYSDKIKALIKAFRDLTAYNIYFTALDKVVDLYGEDVISVDLKQKSLAKNLPQLFDEVFYMKVHQKEDGSKVRALCTSNEIIDFAKDRSGALEPYEKADLQIINDKIFN